MLTDEQIEFIADKANKKINLPIIGEKFEKKIIVFGIEQINKVLDDILPPDFKDLLTNISDGLEPGSPADLEAIKRNLVTFLNKKINLPLLGEEGERQLFELVVDILIDSMRKNDKLAA